MLRARFPLAVAALAAAVALVPATSASAADSGLPGLPSQVQDALDQLGGAGGSGTPDIGGAVTELTDCLAATPEATEDEGEPTPGDATGQDAPTTTPTDESSAPSVRSGDSGGASSSSSEAPNAPDPLDGLTGQSASSVSILAADLDPIGDPLDAGQECIEDFLAGLGAVQAKCFSENNFTAGYLLEKLEEGLGGTPPSADDLEEFQNNLTGLLACLSATPTTEPSAPSGGGGAAATPAPVSEEAPAAVAVTGTPNFTG